MQNSFLRFSTAEVAAGIEYVKAKKGADIDFNFLRMLANETGEYWNQTGRVPSGLYLSKRVIIARHLTRRNALEAFTFDAYSSAVSKLFSRRAALVRARRGAQQISKQSTDPSTPPSIVAEEENGQLTWLF